MTADSDAQLLTAVQATPAGSEDRKYTRISASALRFFTSCNGSGSSCLEAIEQRLLFSHLTEHLSPYQVPLKHFHLSNVRFFS